VYLAALKPHKAKISDPHSRGESRGGSKGKKLQCLLRGEGNALLSQPAAIYRKSDTRSKERERTQNEKYIHLTLLLPLVSPLPQ
jgi:hypothetical protein